MKKKFLFTLLEGFFSTYAQQNLVQYSKPIIGTEKKRNTYLVARVPFLSRTIKLGNRHYFLKTSGEIQWRC